MGDVALLECKYILIHPHILIAASKDGIVDLLNCGTDSFAWDVFDMLQ